MFIQVIDVIQEREGSIVSTIKAFDKLPQKRLLWKLEHVKDLQGRLLKWMEDYPRDREMSTIIRNEKCSWFT